MDEKLKTLAHTIASYSLNIKPNEKVLINYQSTNASELVKYLIKEITALNGICYTNLTDKVIGNLLTEVTNDERIKLIRDYHQFEVDHFDAFISITYHVNDYEGKNVNKEIIKKLGEALQPIQDIRINHRKWVLLTYPSALDAYKAKMKVDDFRDFALDVMTIDYSKMSEDIKPLKELMEKTDKVRIVSPGTDIEFSIKGIPAVPCTGEMNIPDGELYTAPVKYSVNGVITFNTPSPYQGNVYNHVSLTFENGKIIKAECDEDNESLNHIFNTDEGARYVGEFSFGFNPKILHPMGDILYDEKILGSIHFTPGRCYNDANNGNMSSIHWDMVLIQRKDYGGGEIYFDDVLIRKDGMFVLDNLKQLNYGFDQK